MDRLEYFATFEDKKEPEPYNPQNDFIGIAHGGIHVFRQDFEPGKGELADYIPNCKFVMASSKIGLWNLQTREANLFGINNPFSRKDYTTYINTLEKYAVDLLAERMEYYDLPDEGAVMFGLDGMIKVLPSRLDDMYLIVYPGGDDELISNPNTTLLQDDLVTKIERYIGRNIWDWIKKKVSELTTVTYL